MMHILSFSLSILSVYSDNKFPRTNKHQSNKREREEAKGVISLCMCSLSLAFFLLYYFLSLIPVLLKLSFTTLQNKTDNNNNKG